MHSPCIPYFPILIAAAFNGHLDPIPISSSGAIGTTVARTTVARNPLKEV
jgi:hypothetical protein